MRVVLAVSEDGFLSRRPDDDMSWTGRDDKRLFRTLTSVGGGALYAGSRTYEIMRDVHLPGRVLVRLSRASTTLRSQYHNELSGHKEGWLIGGPTVVRDALVCGFVSEVHLSHVPVTLIEGDARLAPILVTMKSTGFTRVYLRAFGGCVHEVWRSSP